MALKKTPKCFKDPISLQGPPLPQGSNPWNLSDLEDSRGLQQVSRDVVMESFLGRETPKLCLKTVKAKVRSRVSLWAGEAGRQAGMASGGAVRELSEELTCPICLDYFQDPLILPECGHNFCRACLTQTQTQSWGEASPVRAAKGPPCPVCKQTFQPGNLRPNRQLANVVEIAKKLRLQEAKRGEATREGEAQERTCEKHREPLQLFCQQDEILICVVCDRSKEHKSHKVIPAEEASQEYKDKILNCLETLRTEKEKILVYLADAEDESQEMLKIVESERQKTVAEFRTLHHLLTEQENRLLAQIEEMEKEITRKRDEHLAKLSEELSSFESLIREMEEKHQQPVGELLQDVRRTLQRCEKKENLENPEVIPSELKWTLRGFCDNGSFLGCVMKQFKDTLVSELQMQKAKVTLDPTAADSKVIVSEDRISVKCQSTPQDAKTVYCTLGREGFTSGCHFWEVRVGNEEAWTVGMVREPLEGGSTLTPEEGIWTVGRFGGQYRALITDICPPLTLTGELKRIRVSLNYAVGQVAFFDADTAALLYRFSGASFSGKTLRPYFAVAGKGSLRLCP